LTYKKVVTAPSPELRSAEGAFFDMKKKRHLGVALGGGGARGFAHLGVLLTLQEQQIPISSIAGTSIGAALGACRALDLPLKTTAKLLCLLDLNDLLAVSDSTIREVQRALGRGMVEFVRGCEWTDISATGSLGRMHELFRLLTANRSFADAKIPYAAVAAELQSGNEIVLTSGKIADAATASAAVPGVFPPFPMDGRLLIDGGVLHKIPADIAIDLGADAVLAVDTGAPLTREVKTSLDALFQSQRITSTHLTNIQVERARHRVGGRLFTLKPDIGWMTIFDFHHVQEAIDAGRDAANAHLEEIRDLIG